MQHKPWARLTSHMRHNSRSCYEAGDVLQGLLLPEHEIVSKKFLAKAKGSAHASEQTTGLRKKCPIPFLLLRYVPTPQTFSIFLESIWSYFLLETGFWLLGCDFAQYSCCFSAQSLPQWKQPACGRHSSCCFFSADLLHILGGNVWVTADVSYGHEAPRTFWHLPPATWTANPGISHFHWTNFKPFAVAENFQTSNPLAWQNCQHFYICFSLSLYLKLHLHPRVAETLDVQIDWNWVTGLDKSHQTSSQREWSPTSSLYCPAELQD